MEDIEKMAGITARLSLAQGKQYMEKYWKAKQRTLQRINNGEPYILSTYYIPGEIFAVFDVPVLFTEQTAGMGAAYSLADTLFCQEQNSFGCSYQKYLTAMFRTKKLPKPTLIIAADFACNDAFSFCKHFAENEKIPFFGLLIKENTADIHRQLVTLFFWIKKYFKVQDSLEAVVQRSNKAQEWKGRIDLLCKQKPGIFPGQEAMYIFPVYNELGRNTAEDCYYALYKMLKNTKYKGLKNREPLLWLGTAPVHTPLLSHIETQYNVCFVFEELFSFPFVALTEKNFFSGLAQRIADSPFFTRQARINFIKEKILEYRVTGVVCFSQCNCEFLPPMVPRIEQTMKKMHIAFLELKGDGIDCRKRGCDFSEEFSFFIKRLKNKI